MSLYQMILDRCAQDDFDDECVLWENAIGKDGYGFVKDPTKGYMNAVHIVAWEAINGPVPKGLELDHITCQVTYCWNPYHLEAVTHSENVSRGNAGKWQLEKTHCPQGHEYNNTNTYFYKRNNARVCRECQRINRNTPKQKKYHREYYRRNREKFHDYYLKSKS